MNVYLKLSALIILCILTSCSIEDKNDKVTLSIHNTSGKNGLVKIKMWNMLNLSDSTIANTEIDSTGNGVLEFTINKPILASLQFGDRLSKVYLEQGYNLSVRIEINTDNPIVYSGHGSKPNNYLQKYSQIQSEIENSGGKNLFELDKKEFLGRIDTLKKSLLRFHNHYTDSINLPANVAALFKERNTIIPLSRIQNYGFNYGARNSFIIPESLDVTNIPYDSSLLKANMGEYAMMWHTYMLLNYYFLLPEGKTKEENEKIAYNAPLIVMDSIIENNYPSFMQEYLLAKNVDYWMASKGISPSVDSVYQTLKNIYPNSFTLVSLKRQYNEWLEISPGKPAPDIMGLTIDGKKLLLTDFRGKVVYIDVWATWCAPCKEEMPLSIKLQNRFSKNDPIVFLYVSVDQKHDAWKKMVTANKEWVGTHIIEPKESDVPSIMTSYKIWGIPRYILIDKKGKIVSADAPNPSSGEVIFQALQDLLNENEI